MIKSWIGYYWRVHGTNERLQEGDWSTSLGNWFNGESSFNLKWWKRESYQPIHYGKFWRAYIINHSITKRQWSFVNVTCGIEKG